MKETGCERSVVNLEGQVYSVDAVRSVSSSLQKCLPEIGNTASKSSPFMLFI